MIKNKNTNYHKIHGPFNLFLQPQLYDNHNWKYKIYLYCNDLSTYYILYNYSHKCWVWYYTHVDNNNKKVVKRLRWGVNKERESDNQLQT